MVSSNGFESFLASQRSRGSRRSTGPPQVCQHRQDSPMVVRSGPRRASSSERCSRRRRRPWLCSAPTSQCP